MKKISRLLLTAVAATSLQGCETMSKQDKGVLIGTVAGGVLGSQFGSGSGSMAAVGIGALAGAFIGGSIGSHLDEYDKKLLAKTSRQALEFSPSGQKVAWNNPDSGNRGSITPTSTFKERGRYCREYTQEVIVGGKKQSAYGKACRQPDGSWEIVK